MWIWKAQGMEPLPGVPGRDLTEEEFAFYAEQYDAQFEPGALASSGFWEQEVTSSKKKEVRDAGTNS